MSSALPGVPPHIQEATGIRNRDHLLEIITRTFLSTHLQTSGPEARAVEGALTNLYNVTSPSAHLPEQADAARKAAALFALGILDHLGVEVHVNLRPLEAIESGETDA
ncbi:MAG TPA: hypothetical protein VLF91_00115 [Candidatus Saccharimonadales bacterium]|nr:hypothetical protein [Candidatus Saccharimonadales bacterium]